ncbi:arylesterase [Coraliomargarita sp. W4R53]
MQRSLFSIFFNRFHVLVGLLALVASSSLLTASTSKRILFFGDSLTAGYGIDPDQAYPALIQQKIDSEQLNAQVVVGAVSGDTSAGGLRRIDWMLRQPVDIFILALGANDGLRGVDTHATQTNLQAIIEKVWTKYPNAQIIIAGMQLPPSFGQAYTQAFAAMYPQLAEKNKIELIPFLLEGVGGRIELNQSDRIHPNPAGHKILAKTVWSTLKPILEASQKVSLK